MNYKNTKYLLNQRPIGMPINDCWILDYENITSISSGEIIIKNEYLSIDPYTVSYTHLTLPTTPYV